KSDPLHARHLRDGRIKNTRDLPHRPQQLSSDHGRMIKQVVVYLMAKQDISKWRILTASCLSRAASPLTRHEHCAAGRCPAAICARALRFRLVHHLPLAYYVRAAAAVAVAC